MIYRAARILLEIVGIAVGGVLVIAAIAIWRLSTAPVEAHVIQPYLEQAVNDAHLGFAVKLTNAKIEWHRFRPVLGLHFQGVSVTGQGGEHVGAFKDGTLGISARDLLFGRISVIEIDIRQPEITIVRDKADHFSLQVGHPQAGGEDTDFKAMLEGFVEQPNDSSQFGRLRRVRLVDGRVVVNDQKLGVTWTAPRVDIDLGRTAAEATARIDISLDLSHQTARLAGLARYAHADGKTTLSLNVSNFDAAAAAPFAQILAPMAALAVPVAGQVHAVIDRSGNLASGDADLNGEQGRLVLPAYYPDPLAIRSMGLKVHFTSAPQMLVLDRMAIELGDARLSVSGTGKFDGPAVAIDARADITGLPLARFGAVWPHGMADGGRDWVTTHIPDGIINSGTVHIAAAGRPNDPDSFQATMVDGAFDYSGMEVHYFPTLPPIRSITGHATFDASRLDLGMESGTLGDLAVSKGSASITGLDKTEQAIDIGLSLQGAVKSVLTILDMKPLGYAHDLGLAPEAVGGRMNMRVNFAFPLVKSLLFNQIALGAKGSLEGVSAPGVVGPRDVTDGTLAIALDKAGMTMDGDARLSGVPVGFSWRESFLATDKVRSRISFHAEPDDADRVALAILPPDPVLIKGKILVKGDVTIDRSHTTTLDATADLKAADIAIEKFGLRKAGGDAGTADLSFVFDGDALRRIPRLKIVSTGLNISGAADLAPDGSLQHAVVSRLTDQRNDFALTADAKPMADGKPGTDAKPGNPRAYAISIKGVQFDATALLAGKSSGGPPTHTPRIDLTLALDHVLTGPTARLDAVGGTATLSGGRLDRADIKAVAGRPLTLTYLPSGDVIALHFAADDAGAALADLGLTRGVRGGTMRLDGTTDPGGRGPWLTTGTLDIRNFRLTDAPIAARLVNAVSPTGFVDLLSGQGLGVDHLSAEMDYVDGKITFRNGRSTGALGISFEGDIDLAGDRVALKGTVVPVDTLNRIVAAIPLIGDVLTGGNRGGFIGWTYSVTGSPNDPQVSVNPLSMFALGFLRNLFFLGPSEPEPTSQAPPPAPAQPSAEDKSPTAN
ncbi:MAG: hypothetical protein JWM91_1628 [Rhodospirillales bacterium]|nr:hypothetical protein [Rhodospirillales bacterium]